MIDRRLAVALDLVKRTRRNPIRAGRALALLHAAINDAVVASWDAKEAYFRERPAVLEPALLQQGPVNAALSTFPSEQAALKCLYLVTRSLDPTGDGRARWTMRWKPALNAFAITFADRFPAAETY